MPIDSTHPEYKLYEDAFIDCRNAFEGSRAIKDHGKRYLPMLKDQDKDQYAAYLNRALFFSITSRTVSALVGLVMMRPPIVRDASEVMKPYFEEANGAQFLELASTTLQEVLLMGGYGILIDGPQAGGMPQLVRYGRESVINWRTDGNGNPVLIVLREIIDQQKGDDEYEIEKVKQYRELRLTAEGYVQRIFNEKGEIQKVIVPTMGDRPLDFIPFFMINTLGVSMGVQKPPMLDIVDLNISHFRTSADLEHGRHFTGLPTPVISGIETSTPMYIGSQTAWVLPNPDAKAYYMEFEGQGLQSLEKALTEKQSQMASMSARLIDNSKRGSEAAETVKLRYMSEAASLITVVRSVEQGLSLVYNTLATLLGEPPLTIDLNKDFMDTKMSATDLTAIVNAYIEGTISKDTLIYNLRKGDVIPRSADDLKEKNAIREPAPAGGPQT